MLNFLKKTEKTAKSVDEAKKLALAELGVGEEDVTFEVNEEGVKGFLGIGAKDASVTATVLDVPAAAAKKFLSDVFAAMGLEVEIKAVTEDNVLAIELFGDNMGIVIGKRGDTLDGLQYLTSLTVNSVCDDYIKVTIDTENYRQKRHDALIALSERLAAKAIKTGRRQTLEPMNPYERRIIHANLQQNDGVTTYSVGEDPYRKVVIAPKNAQSYTKKSGYASRGGYGKKSSYGGYSSYESKEYTSDAAYDADGEE